MPNLVAYSVSPFGTGTIETGAGNISITSGVATLTVAQTGNIGAGVEIEYNSLHAYIAPNRIGFDSGGTAELLPDTKIAGATSGATGIVRFVEVTGGTWAGGNAAGWIYFEKTTGTFQNNEQINRTKPTTSDNIATVNGTIEGNIGNGNTEFVVKSAVGADAANQSATAVTSIHHVWASLSAFEAAFTGANFINNTNLTTADIAAHACCYYDHDDQTADTTAFTINGTTTDSTRNIVLFCPLGGSESINRQQSSGVWDTNKYRLQAAVTGSGVLIIDNANVDIRGLQTMNTHTSANYDAGVFLVQNGIAVGTILIDSCIIRFEDTGASMGFRSGVRCYSPGSGLIKVINSIIYDVRGGTTDYTNGIQIGGASIGVYFCTVSNCLRGVCDEGATSEVKNSALFNCYDDIRSFDTIDYCASDDGDGTNAEDFTAEATDWAKVFNDYANGDFSLKNYTTNPCCIDEGTSLAASEGIWRDIAGNERGATPDIGAFEYVAAGGVTLVMQDLTHSHSLDGALSVSQLHNLTVGELLHSHSLDASALTQNHSLTISDITHSQSLEGNLLIGMVHVLVIQELLHSHLLNTPTLAQLHNLTVADLIHSHSLDNIILVVAGVLIVQDLLHTHSLDSPVLVQNHSLTIQELLHSHNLDVSILTQNHSLTVDELLHSHSLEGNITLSTILFLIVQDLLHDHNLDSPALAQAHTLTLQELLHSHSLDTITITQLHGLAVSDLLHNHNLDGNLNLSTIIELVVQDLLHGHSLDVAGILEQTHILLVDDVGHIQSLDSLTLAQAHSLTINDILHGHALDTIVIYGEASGVIIAFTAAGEAYAFTATDEAYAFTATDENFDV